jgi:hypothetical protein
MKEPLHAVLQGLTFRHAQMPGFIEGPLYDLYRQPQFAGMVLIPFGELFYGKHIMRVHCDDVFPEDYSIFPL